MLRHLNGAPFFWLLLALPAALMLNAYASGSLDAQDMLHPTGEFSVRMMVIAMMIGPLVDIFGPKRWLRWLMARRRWLGFAAFLYALAHLVFYVIDMETVAAMLDEMTELGIWTGWAALLLMAVPAVTSNDAAMRTLRRGWKRGQQFAYPAAVLTVLHWGFLTWEWGGALFHFGPLAVLNLVRIAKRKSLFRKGVPA